MYIKERGSLNLEFIPKEVSLTDPSRKTLVIKNKKMINLHGEDFHQILNLKEELQITRKFKELTSTLTLRQLPEGVHFHLSITEVSAPEPVTRDLTVRPGEFFLVQRYLDFALPHVMGWYALGNSSLAEQNLSYTSEMRADPFDKI